jgi:hypothetical protein
MVWPRRNAPVLLLCAALLASGTLVLVLTRDLTYFQDTWAFLMHRRELSVDALLQPHNEHIVLIPVAFEILFLNVFGMSSALPEFVLLTAMLLVSATLLFVYARRRVGDWLALMAATLLLFLGPAWQDLLWPFELGFVGTILFGIATLLALDRDDGPGDVAACAFLILAAGFSSLGVAFMAAAAVNLLQRRQDRGLRRAYLVAIPALLFAAWYAGWGRDAESHLALRNVLDSPHYVVEGLAASVESLLGLSTAPIEGIATVGWGQPLLVALVALVAYRQFRHPGFSPGFWPVAAATATSWFLTAFSFIAGREATTGRYMYAGGVFVLLLAVELLRDVRFGRRALVVSGAITLAAVASNLHFLHDGADWLKGQTVLTRSDLAAIEISRRTVDPDFRLTPAVAGTPSLIDVSAGDYLEAETDFGSPAYTPQELAGAPAAGRRQADVVLSRALPLSTVVRPGARIPGPERGDCISAGGSSRGVPLASGAARIEVAPGPPARISLRRFATGVFPVHPEGAPGNSVTILRIPPDRAPQPWYLHVDAAQRARVCR